MDVRERFDDISLELNLTSAVSFAAWSSYETTRKRFCLEVSTECRPFRVDYE